VDIVGYRIFLPTWLDHDYRLVLDQLHDEIEGTANPSKNLLTAKNMIHALTGMAHRLSPRAAALHKKVGDAFATIINMGGHLTFKDVAVLYGEFNKFRKAFVEFASVSGSLVTLTVTKEDVPLAWDDTYGKMHGIITSFRDDYQRFTTHALDSFEHKLKDAVGTVAGILAGYGPNKLTHTPWIDWRMPHDFQEAADIVKRSAN